MENVWMEDAVKLLIAAFLGGAVGLERTSHGRAAGFRTYLLVTTGSALIMMISLHVPALIGVQGGQVAPYVRIDLSHLATGALTGIGFPGGGVIMRGKDTVHG